MATAGRRRKRGGAAFGRPAVTYTCWRTSSRVRALRIRACVCQLYARTYATVHITSVVRSADIMICFPHDCVFTIALIMTRYMFVFLEDVCSGVVSVSSQQLRATLPLRTDCTWCAND